MIDNKPPAVPTPNLDRVISGSAGGQCYGRTPDGGIGDPIPGACWVRSNEVRAAFALDLAEATETLQRELEDVRRQNSEATYTCVSLRAEVDRLATLGKDHSRKWLDECHQRDAKIAEAVQTGRRACAQSCGLTTPPTWGWSMAGHWYVTISTGANRERPFPAHIECTSESQAHAIAEALGGRRAP